MDKKQILQRYFSQTNEDKSILLEKLAFCGFSDEYDFENYFRIDELEERVFITVLGQYPAACSAYKLAAGLLTAHGLGDWGNPAQGSQATANIETAFYYCDLVVMSEFAALIGKPEE